MNWPDFRKEFPYFVLSPEELDELLRDGCVAVGVGNRRVFTLRIEAEESDIPELY